MNIWLDDIRTPPPTGRPYIWVKTVTEAIELMENNEAEFMSLDHDLGNDPGGDAIKFVLWMCENNKWPKNKPLLHTANPVGRKNMQSLIDRYGPY